MNDIPRTAGSPPAVSGRAPARAVEAARKAVEKSAGNPMYVNTLGVALYRAGQWAEAIAALTESSEAQPNHAVYDWLDLAMAHWQRGEKDAALQWHAKAADGIKANPDLKQLEPTQVDELRRFFAEASELLGIKVELPSHGGEKP